jgi:hypothetical protein
VITMTNEDGGLRFTATISPCSPPSLSVGEMVADNNYRYFKQELRRMKEMVAEQIADHNERGEPGTGPSDKELERTLVVHQASQIGEISATLGALDTLMDVMGQTEMELPNYYLCIVTHAELVKRRYMEQLDLEDRKVAARVLAMCDKDAKELARDKFMGEARKRAGKEGEKV